MSDLEDLEIECCEEFCSTLLEARHWIEDLLRAIDREDFGSYYQLRSDGLTHVATLPQWDTAVERMRDRNSAVYSCKVNPDNTGEYEIEKVCSLAEWEKLLLLLDRLESERSLYRGRAGTCERINNIVRDYAEREKTFRAKCDRWREDMSIYLRALALIAESVGDGGTHVEKNARLRGMISAIEMALKRIRDDSSYFNWDRSKYNWEYSDLFGSDYSWRKYVDRIKELEAEIERLKNPDAKQESYVGETEF